MSITHHPSDVTLVGFASRSFDEGKSLLLATHLSFCQECRKAVRAFEHVGGAFLDQVEPVPLRTDAMQRAIARIHWDVAGGRSSPLSVALRNFQPPVSKYALGPWRWISPGLHLRSVSIPDRQTTRVFMLKAASGMGVPRHRHAGMEWTCVLEGAFRHDLSLYRPGDFEEADETHEHTLFAEGGAPCICLIALQGNLHFESWLARGAWRLGGIWTT
jgi:putative transcriptional regulator